MNEQILVVDEKQMSITDILEYGNDALVKVGESTANIADDKLKKIDKTEILSSLNRILDKIDYDELKMANNLKTKRGLSKLIDTIMDKGGKILSKYTTVASELEGMYFTVTKWKTELNSNNVALMEVLSNLKEAKTALETYYERGEEIVKKMPESTVEEAEMKSMMAQKVQDIYYSIGVTKQSILNYNALLKTNFTIRRKLESVYNTTLPTIQTQINTLTMTQDQSRTIESLQVLDEKRDELIKFGSQEIISAGKQAIEQIGYSKENFEILDDTTKMLQVGMNEILQAEQAKILEIENVIEDRRMLKNEKS